MDLLFEIILGFLFEAPVEATMESKRVKTWVKTALFLLLGLLVEALFVYFLCVSCTNDSDTFSIVLMSALSFGWPVLMIWATIYGHKHKWKQDI